MNAKTVIAAVAAALSVTMTLAGCGDSTSGAAPGTAQDSTATTVSSSTVAPRDTTTADPTISTVPSTTDVTADTTPDATSTTVPATTLARPAALVDELVLVHGARLHVHCEGAGPTTVVLIAGFGGGPRQLGRDRTDPVADHASVFLRTLRHRHQ